MCVRCVSIVAKMREIFLKFHVEKIKTQFCFNISDGNDSEKVNLFASFSLGLELLDFEFT